MKTVNFLSALSLVIGLSASAQAETYTAKHDPSGAQMCFDSSGQKASLGSCEGPVQYLSSKDPSGAEQCFTSKGTKAPLSSCQAKAQAVAVEKLNRKSSPFLAAVRFFR